MNTPRRIPFFSPKGTYRAAPFYFRGSDQFREPESLQKEYNTLLYQYHNIKKDYDLIKEEYDQFSHEQLKTEDYFHHIAQTKCDEDAIEHSDALKTLNQLNQEMEEVESKLKQLKDMENLQTEHTIYSTEITNFYCLMEKEKQSIIDTKKAIVQVMISDQYQSNLNLLIESEANTRYKNLIRTKVSNIRDKLINKPPIKSVNPVDDQDLLWLFEEEIEMSIQIFDIRLQKRTARIHQRVKCSTLLSYCDELNQLITDLGGEPIDLTEMKNKCKSTRMSQSNTTCTSGDQQSDK